MKNATEQEDEIRIKQVREDRRRGLWRYYEIGMIDLYEWKKQFKAMHAQWAREDEGRRQ